MILTCSVVAFSQIKPANAASEKNLFNEPIRPLPEKINLDQQKVRLGKKLFSDVRLSRTNKISCVSCHDFSSGGADARISSLGVDGRNNLVNTPTIFNSALNFRQHWDGRARSLEEQIELSIKDAKVFDTSWGEIIGKLSTDTILINDFKNIYTDGFQRRNIVDALATFERSLITPSRFDRYLRGDENAISEGEKLGYAKFKSYGCIACHQGINVGGNMFQVFGAMRALPENNLQKNTSDFGRFASTKRETDKRVFKVPSLRNVALTAPYFHDGSARTLEQAVDIMFKHQLGRTASAGDQALIIKFLQSLTGEQQSGGLQKGLP